jgi:hypothetical protein
MLSNFDIGPNFYVIIGSILGFFIGWFGGFFDSNQRTARKIRIAEADAEKKMQDAEIKIREAESKIALSSQPAQNLPDDPGLLRLKNDKGQFVLQMDGTPVIGPLSPEKKKRLIDLITVIRPWLEGGQPPQVTAQLTAPVQTPRPSASDPARELIYAVGQSPTQPLPPLAKKPEAEKNIATLSIVAQIDTVLQARLADTPFAKTGVRLQESPQGGVEVYVGLDKFLSVDDVPDETIKATIRAAIAEWEDKFTPGFKNPY